MGFDLIPIIGKVAYGLDEAGKCLENGIETTLKASTILSKGLKILCSFYINIEPFFNSINQSQDDFAQTLDKKHNLMMEKVDIQMILKANLDYFYIKYQFKMNNKAYSKNIQRNHFIIYIKIFLVLEKIDQAI